MASINITDHIKAVRGAGTIADILLHTSASVTEAAARFGLSDDPGCYQEINVLEAAQVLEYVFHKDMAYGMEIMPLATAIKLANQFIAEFLDESPRFYTNGEWGRRQFEFGIGPGWMPATDATFDTGVLVLSDYRTGCVWCMDED